jgi:hypothetical protein
MRNTFIKSLAIMAMLAYGHTSYAADSFQGTIWSLSYSGAALADSDPLHETYRVTLDVNTSGYTGGGSFIDQVAVKVSSSLYGASLVSGPGGASNWSISNGGIGAYGCTGNGGGFECADGLILAGNTAVPGGTYSWVFDLTMDNGLLFTGLLESSVKGRFVDANGRKVGALVSENVTLTSPVPEPEIYAMMGLGLGLIGWVGRRKKRAAV